MECTVQLGTVTNVWSDLNQGLDLENLAIAEDNLFRRIRNSSNFSKRGNTKLLDLGSSDKGSKFVNRYSKEFPNVNIFYLDSHIPFLQKSEKLNKIGADGISLPFKGRTFDVVYVGDVINEGIVKDGFNFGNQSYRIGCESYRVLKEDGLFVFTQDSSGDKTQTVINLNEIGFSELIHLQRLLCYAGSSSDTFVAIK
jgi:SAM-dependent methyltransferase